MVHRGRAWVAFCVVLGGCGGGGGDPDAGLPVDAYRDDAVTLLDTGIVTDCTGFPIDCSTQTNATDCAAVLGCGFTQCAGFPIACERLVTEGPCTAQLGCAWSGTACTGTAAPCGPLPDETSCRAHMGCTYVPTARCMGVPTPCGYLPNATCTMQIGCMIGMPDAG